MDSYTKTGEEKINERDRKHKQERKLKEGLVVPNKRHLKGLGWGIGNINPRIKGPEKSWTCTHPL